jgi:hypothetical protein
MLRSLSKAGKRLSGLSQRNADPAFYWPALIAPRIFAATSGPPNRAMAEMPISDLTSIFSPAFHREERSNPNRRTNSVKRNQRQRIHCERFR